MPVHGLAGEWVAVPGSSDAEPSVPVGRVGPTASAELESDVTDLAICVHNTGSLHDRTAEGIAKVLLVLGRAMGMIVTSRNRLVGLDAEHRGSRTAADY